MKILLDECVDQRFRRDLVGHEVITVQEAGWGGKKNGELLAFAAKTYQVFGSGTVCQSHAKTGVMAVTVNPQMFTVSW